MTHDLPPVSINLVWPSGYESTCPVAVLVRAAEVIEPVLRILGGRVLFVRNLTSEQESEHDDRNPAIR